jgi:hypothetical protein
VRESLPPPKGPCGESNGKRLTSRPGAPLSRLLLPRIALLWSVCLGLAVPSLGLAQPPPSAPSTPSTPSGAGGISEGMLDTRWTTRSRDRYGPRRDSLQAVSLGPRTLHLLLGGFDQGAGLPFGIELTTADRIKGVELRARAITSTRLYQRFELGVSFPRFFDERTHLDLWASYRLRTRDNFFGIGPATSRSPETNYAHDQRAYHAQLSRELAPRIIAGLAFQVANSNAYPGREKGTHDLPIGQFVPVEGLPGLHSAIQTVGWGGFLEIDRRNDERGLTRGGALFLRLLDVHGVGRVSRQPKDLIAPTTAGWRELEVDLRGYLPLGSDFTSLALRFFSDQRHVKADQLIPFYELPWLGGRNHHRGFRNFRFRGSRSLLFSLEPRQTIWKPTDTRGIDLFVFVDAGGIWGGPFGERFRKGPDVSERFRWAHVRYGAGGGIQFRLNPRTAFRLDLGGSREQRMAFLSFSRGF